VARTSRKPSQGSKAAKAYDHTEQPAVLRPDIGLQAEFKKKKEPATYRYDRSLDPQLSWDINADREHGESLIAQIQEAAAKLDKATDPAQIRHLKSQIENAAAELRRMSRPFLNWAGKAERPQFTVPTLPLFVHERLSTRAILKSVETHKQQLDLFADAKLDLAERVLRAYEHQTGWVNRLILGDSLVAMNSLLKYEGLGGQVQCIYLDPPYGVKFGSNFQPFIRKRDVRHNDDSDFTREPEMVQAYRDTWELGLHSYLTYLRDRFLLCRELLHPSGSIFVQISDENLHHVRELLDEAFGVENFCSVISFAKTTSTATNLLSQEFDYLLWYARDKTRVKYRQLFLPKNIGSFRSYRWAESPDGKQRRPLTAEERSEPSLIPHGWRVFQVSFLASQEPGDPNKRIYCFEGKEYDCGANRHWKTTNPEGLDRLAQAGRIIALGTQLNFKRYFDDFPAIPVTNMWVIRVVLVILHLTRSFMSCRQTRQLSSVAF